MVHFRIISATDEYKKKVTTLRNKVSSLQKERQNLLNSVATQRRKARNELLKNLNPIVKTYMNDNNIRMVLDKKNLLLADENLDITKEIDYFPTNDKSEADCYIIIRLIKRLHSN